MPAALEVLELIAESCIGKTSNFFCLNLMKIAELNDDDPLIEACERGASYLKCCLKYENLVNLHAVCLIFKKFHVNYFLSESENQRSYTFLSKLGSEKTVNLSMLRYNQIFFDTTQKTTVG